MDKRKQRENRLKTIRQILKSVKDDFTIAKLSEDVIEDLPLTKMSKDNIDIGLEYFNNQILGINRMLLEDNYED